MPPNSRFPGDYRQVISRSKAPQLRSKPNYMLTMNGSSCEIGSSPNEGASSQSGRPSNKSHESTQETNSFHAWPQWDSKWQPAMMCQFINYLISSSLLHDSGSGMSVGIWAGFTGVPLVIPGLFFTFLAKYRRFAFSKRSIIKEQSFYRTSIFLDGWLMYLALSTYIKGFSPLSMGGLVYIFIFTQSICFIILRRATPIDCIITGWTGGMYKIDYCTRGTDWPWGNVRSRKSDRYNTLLSIETIPIDSVLKKWEFNYGRLQGRERWRPRTISVPRCHSKETSQFVIGRTMWAIGKPSQKSPVALHWLL